MNDLEKEIQEIEKEIQKDNKKNIVIKEECQVIMDKHNLESISFQKPFLKWVGGKTQILTEILNKFPLKINNYHEIFLGGGSVLLGIISLIKENKLPSPKNIYAYDLNKSLIYLYKNIQTK